MLLRQMMRRASVLQSSPCGVRHLRSKANVQRDNAVTGTYSGVIFSLAGLVVVTPCFWMGGYTLGRGERKVVPVDVMKDAPVRHKPVLLGVSRGKILPLMERPANQPKKISNSMEFLNIAGPKFAVGSTLYGISFATGGVVKGLLERD